MAAIARKDYEQRRERQAQGIEKAKAAGKYQGRPIDSDLHRRVIELLGAGLSAQQLGTPTALQLPYYEFENWPCHDVPPYPSASKIETLTIRAIQPPFYRSKRWCLLGHRQCRVSTTLGIDTGQRRLVEHLKFAHVRRSAHKLKQPFF